MKYGLIGEHLKHSFSKIIHEEIGDYVYEIKEIEPQNVDSFMKAKDFKAINVTIPYKETVIPYLDYIDDSAKKIGAVNTIVNNNFKLYGYNTDYSGMKALAMKIGLEIKDKKVLIIGTGGTSKTATAVVTDMGAKEIIYVSNIQVECAYSYEEVYANHTDAEIIFNTSPVGMYPKNDGIPIDLSKFPRLEGLLDVVYNPIRTNLVIEAQRLGIKAEGGLYMLGAQAVYAYEHFMATSVDKSLCDSIFKKVLAEKDNIVLTGMPSSGKTTVGKVLAQKTGKTFVDTDDEIVKKIGMDIPSYFAKYGEAEFRKVESEVIKELSPKNSLIIATGGGAILNYDNIRRLKQNGKIYFINRSLENLTPTSDRPLSSDVSALEKRYNERYPIYISTADTVIDGNSTVEDVANAIYGEYIK
ncbi:MAG: shikimate dehydrogenase [Clostridia bacterium]|nr:shikimate dehydrogenase [Clostridia bacterium]